MPDPKNIKLDYSRDDLITPYGEKKAQDGYLLPGETIQEMYARASAAFADDDDHAQRLYDYASKQWFGFATPLLTNGGTQRGLPISCYLSAPDDSREGIMAHLTEQAHLSTEGGAVGAYWGNIRANGTKTSRGSSSTGLVPFLKVADSNTLAFSQGDTRRGAYAAYIDISHPEIQEFIGLKKPTGGSEKRKCLNSFQAVNIPDAFMEAVIDDAEWDLVDPHSKEVVETVNARELWVHLLQTRCGPGGTPYIFFSDAVDRDYPQELKDQGLKCVHSNLCSEITLAATPDYTSVCCLSSVNAAKYEEWVDDPKFIGDLVRMLDNALTVFEENAPEALWRAVKSVKNERSIGLGMMGWATLLQKNGLAWSDPEAEDLARLISKDIQQKALNESYKLAGERGEPVALKGTGKRNAHVIAIAPTASNSVLCGEVSEGIQPLAANAFKRAGDAGRGIWKNPELMKIIPESDVETWKSIIENQGSVQHLDSLTAREKEVFKTAWELDQTDVVTIAAARQPYVCQAQSINLFFKQGIPINLANKVHVEAWRKGLKTLYYVRMLNDDRAGSTVDKSEREVFPDTTESIACSIDNPQNCQACEG